VSPHKFKRGRVAHLSNLPTSGTQNAGKPLANGGGQRGWRGHKPPPRGFGGCAPKNQKREQVAHLSNLPTRGAQNAGKPLANGVGI